MNILFCQPTLEYTGSEISLLGITGELRALNKDRLYLLVGKDGPMRSRYEPVVDDLTIVDAPKLKRDFSVVPGYLRSFFTVFNAVRRIKKRRDISVVYVNTLMFPQAVIAAALNRLRCVVHIREVESKYPRVYYQAYLALASLAAEKIICVCRYILGQKRVVFRRKLIAKSHVVYNASPFDNPPITRSIDDVLRILTVGTLNREKGTGDVLAFAEALARSLSGRRFELDIVGHADDEDLLNTLKAGLRGAGLEDRVRFHGVQKDIAPFFRDAHVFLHLARTDVFPRVLVEAASFSLPVITTNAGGCPESVDHGQTGFVVPVGDCEAMAGYAKTLAGDPALYRRLSAAAYKRYQERYTLKHMIGGVRSVLGELA